MEQEQLRKEAERRAKEYVSRDLLEPYNKGRIIDGYTKGFLAGAEWEAEREKWIEFDKQKPKIGKSVLISFISTLNDQRVYKVDELLKDGTFRFTTRIDGITWSEITPPKTSKK